LFDNHHSNLNWKYENWKLQNLSYHANYGWGNCTNFLHKR
jgi:hypothetical protein